MRAVAVCQETYADITATPHTKMKMNMSQTYMRMCTQCPHLKYGLGPRDDRRRERRVIQRAEICGEVERERRHAAETNEQEEAR